MSKELVKQITDYIRTYEFIQGDQYGSWIGTSPDAETLAQAVEANFMNEADLVLVWETAKKYAERTGLDFWKLSLVQQRKEIENFYEDQETANDLKRQARHLFSEDSEKV